MRLKSLTGFLAVLFMQGVSLSGKGPQWADMARDGLICSLAGNSLYPYKTRGGCAGSGTAPSGSLYSPGATCSKGGSSGIGALLQDEHGIAIGPEVVLLANSLLVSVEDEVVSAESRYHHEHGRVG